MLAALRLYNFSHIIILQFSTLFVSFFVTLNALSTMSKDI